MARNVLRPSHSILVVAGGMHDRESLLEAGLGNVVISNLDYHHGVTDYAPFTWKNIDAERIALPDETYDWVIVHAGLHHLGVPAQGVCEMFRVCREGIICFEARDSLLMRLAIKSSLTSDYELEPAFLSGGMSGGYRNGPIPNYVYRWTEREFEKVVKSFHPAYKVDFAYFYGLSVPLQKFAMARSPIRRFIGHFFHAISSVYSKILPRQGNQFGMVAIKTDQVQPWLAKVDGRLCFREEAMSATFDKGKYVSAS
jgi:SAM-dependent methyltransferase